MSEGKVYLAGGGCGDAELLTLRALKALQECDTVVYDSLVSEELLQWTRTDCEKIYVGKRYGYHSRGQLEINALLIKKAREGKTVVRLKGGDPYVFGRGGEEFMALRDAGVRCEVIPGVTSAIAVPAAAGIPVTHRGLSDSVTVVTGTAAETGGKAELKLDFQTLAQLKGTLVILMGMHHLAEIVVGLLAAGKDRNTPCAIVMEGTTEKQRTVRAPLFELAARAAERGLTAPAVIVVGAVAKLELIMYDMPLAGITVGVTGTARFADKLSSVLREKGADIRDMSFMEIRPSVDSLPDLADCGWLVFTSPNGVEVFLEKMRRERLGLRTLSGHKIAVIGPGTAERIKEAGLYADYMPEVYDAAHLAEGLSDIVMAGKAKEGPGGTGGAQSKVMFLRAKQGSDVLPRIFRERGIPYEEHALYELGVQKQKRDAVIAKEPDYIVFGSAMGARAYFEGMEKNGIRNTRSRYVCIGEQCAKEVRKYVAEPPLIAKKAEVEGIVDCLCKALAYRRKEEKPCTDSED